MTAERLSQNATVQALATSNFEGTAKSLPSRIQQVFDVPKIWEMTQATSEASVTGFIEFELIKLAERINVSGNLTNMQIQDIAKHIVREYPNETIADFKICFERAANGTYGKIFKLDGIEVGLWVTSYLDEKYRVLEDELMREKERYKNESFKSDAEWLRLWKESIEKTDSEGGVKTQSQNLTILQNLRAMTDQEIRQEGQEKPKYKPYLNGLTPEHVAMKDAIRKSAGEFYKGNFNWTGFAHFPFGEFTVFAASKEDADKIMEEATKSINQAEK